MLKIQKVYGLEVLDSRGNPTVCAQVQLSSGVAAAAAVPSGASTGQFEAHELRDGDLLRYGGKGVRRAVEHIETQISPALERLNDLRLQTIDTTMIELDGTENKSKLGANAMLAVSIACARALAMEHKQPLFRFLGGECACRLPVPMLNILNGGAHAGNNVDIQEFMIVPKGISAFPEALRVSSEIYHTLGGLLREKGLACGVGDEGGFAPSLESDEAALDLLCEAIERAGFSDVQVQIALDAAASEWYSEGGYLLPKRQVQYSAEGLISRWEELCGKYPICSIEDPLGETDTEGWQELTRRLGQKVQLVGDDLFVTHRERVAAGVEQGIANAVLIKPNQVGTLTETYLAIEEAKKAGYGVILSHRSGETEDTTIADLAVAWGAGMIKTGAPCRGERTAKYNRLLQIARQTANCRG